MDWWLGTAIIVAMFVLRLGVPLAIIFILGYGLRRLDAKWQAEAQAQQQSQPTSAPEPKIELLKIIEHPCWEIKNCPKNIRDRCPAYLHPDTPCWMTKRRVEGRLQPACYQCPLFIPRRLRQLVRK